MTSRQRFFDVLRFRMPGDRIPRLEWAAWWDETIRRWESEGMPKGLSFEQSLQNFHLDNLTGLYAAALAGDAPKPLYHGGSIIADEKGYEAIRPYLYLDAEIEKMRQNAIRLKERHDRGEIIIRLALEGFFWFPRTLLGIEPHLYAFYDNPEFMHRINNDLADFSMRVIDEVFSILTPDMVNFSEDMSYNHGPMLSYQLFKEFLAPYYDKIVPRFKKHGAKVFIDSDGDIHSMIPWMIEAGIEGVFPLERQAGVDILKIRREYPEFLMLGGYDKMAMPQGEEAMRAEFERILPVMKSGGYIPSVDHMTPPGVSLENYKIYSKLFKEYSEKAVM